MPHSGGGGSHGGGGHGGGGSHHSSSSSSSTRSIRVSSRPFKGCHSYAVYDKDGRSRLIYSDSAYYKKGMSKAEYIATLLFSALFVVPGLIAIIIGLVAFFSMFRFGIHKTTYPARTNTTVCIYDDYNLISDKEEANLRSTLEQFRDKTGIIPAVEFVTDDRWANNYVDMERFAYNEYVNHFFDEYHLLIVYSYSDVDPYTGFNEFYYHTMWGDKLSKTAGRADEDKLIDELQRQLSIANGKNVPKAISDSFKNFYTILAKPGFRFNPDTLSTCIFLIIWGTCFGGGGVVTAMNATNSYKAGISEDEIAVKINGEPKRLYCSYCNCAYYEGTVGNCPHCGAPFYDEARC